MRAIGTGSADEYEAHLRLHHLPLPSTLTNRSISSATASTPKALTVQRIEGEGVSGGGTDGADEEEPLIQFTTGRHGHRHRHHHHAQQPLMPGIESHLISLLLRTLQRNARTPPFAIRFERYAHSNRIASFDDGDSCVTLAAAVVHAPVRNAITVEALRDAQTFAATVVSPAAVAAAATMTTTTLATKTPSTSSSALVSAADFSAAGGYHPAAAQRACDAHSNVSAAYHAFLRTDPTLSSLSSTAGAKDATKKAAGSRRRSIAGDGTLSPPQPPPRALAATSPASAQNATIATAVSPASSSSALSSSASSSSSPSKALVSPAKSAKTSTAGTVSRAPAHAGSLYSSDAAALHAELDQYIERAKLATPFVPLVPASVTNAAAAAAAATAAKAAAAAQAAQAQAQARVETQSFHGRMRPNNSDS